MAQRANRTNQAGRGTNLSQEDRERGGERSAASQQRDSEGQWAGKHGGQSQAGPAGTSQNPGSRPRDEEGRFTDDIDETGNAPGGRATTRGGTPATGQSRQPRQPRDEEGRFTDDMQ